MRIDQQKIDRSVTQCTILRQRKRSSQIRQRKNCGARAWVEERKASQKYTTANAGSISRRINKKRLVEKAEQMKGKQCVVTPQNYYWMSKKKSLQKRWKNNLAVAHVFKWLELITLAGYNQSYEWGKADAFVMPLQPHHVIKISVADSNVKSSPLFNSLFNIFSLSCSTSYLWNR